jgi:hypothetical protein
MNEGTEKATAQDVLQSSELNARLLRRLTASPGVIDVQMLRQIPVRRMGSPAPLVSLFDELTARYGIDDGSMGNQPLVLEQPWIQNVNSYLTNYNSFSSTTNQFISIPATEQKSRTEIGKMIEERAFTDVELRLVHPSSSILPPDHSSSRPETFRIHRRPARRASEDVSTSSASAAAPIRDAPASVKGEQLIGSEASDLKSVRPEVIPASSVLPLAHAQVQRTFPDKSAARAGRTPGQANQTEEGKAAGGQFQLVLAKALKQTAAPRTWVTAEDQETETRSKDVSREILARSSLRSNLESFDLVQSQAALSQLQKRATDFVWRRRSDVPTGRDLTAVDSSSRLKAVDSLPQLPRDRQTIKPQSTNRKGEHRTGSRQMTERIVRNISRKLLIERERRGY